MRAQQHEEDNEQEARGEARVPPPASLSRGAMRATRTRAASAAFDAHDGAHELAGFDLNDLVVHRNDAQRLLLINGIPIQFSPLEYRVMLALIARIGTPVPFDTLTRAATYPGEAPCSRMALERHIDRIRQKLRVCGVEVRGVTGYGCILMHE